MFQRDGVSPTQCVQAADVQKLAWGAVRFGNIKDKLALITNRSRHKLSEFPNRDVLAGSNIDDLGFIIMLHQKYCCCGEIIDM